MRVFNYVILMLGMLVLFDYAGLIVGDSSGILALFGFIRDGTTLTFNPSLSNVFDFILSDIEEIGIGVLSGIIIAGIAIGTVAKGKLENFIILPIITTILVFFISAMKDVVMVSFTTGTAWIGWIIAFVGLVFTGGFIISLYEHFRGTD